MENMKDIKLKEFQLLLRPFQSKDHSSRLFLSGIRKDVTESEIEKVFSEYGKIADKSISQSSKPYVNNAILNFDEE